MTTSDSCDLRLPTWHILFRMTKKKKEVTSVFQETVTRTTWFSPHLPHSPEGWMKPVLLRIQDCSSVGHHGGMGRGR